MRSKIKCDWCNAELFRSPSGIKKHNFCSKKCQGKFSSKKHNPKRYTEMNAVEKQSAWMSELNRRLNPTRMNLETRTKIREKRLSKSSSTGYRKQFGRHEHRVVAEEKLGRLLRADEVVHHIDCNKRNNHPDNLMVLTQSEHAKLHMRLNKFFGLKGLNSEI